ncbi:predicted protein [Thalassiosira pseudonana CCMP1335]|uniref:O-fucosyltransferase family protein n=1 Tax=Thalassiosira pseudonana TaxID=35128 RepID=B8C6P2_THAPS|nr:predicted protein [Thalassiosira pseudonana CCMP1335]EED90839.1 predicted protein [Thalassiosira pseudonana CCMP1335]
MTSNQVLPSSVSSPSSSGYSTDDASRTSTNNPTKLKTNRLFLTFAILCFMVAIVNIQFHHQFHDEHVGDKLKRDFHERHFQTSRTNNAATDSIGSETNNINDSNEIHKLAGLHCEEKYGGPNDAYAENEMAFWSDIPSDASYKSPFMIEGEEKFLTFEPDHGGWNNIRMAMETALVMSHAMGRTLVLPPEQRFYLLGKSDQQQKNDFDFGDFFHLDSIAIEHENFNVISSEEFLQRFGKTGKLNNVQTGKPEIWDEKQHSSSNVQSYLRKVGLNPVWNPTNCIAAFPSTTGPESVAELRLAHKDIFSEANGRKRPSLEEFEGKPVDVDAPMEERMRELMADRDELCVYDERLQKAQVLHFPAEKGTRLLTHFYAFIFFADWKADLWSKRFVRDHLRYIDEIMCAAARVVKAVRERSKDNGLFDSMHVRRGDFQYKKTRLEANELIAKSKDNLIEGGLLYIATDERNKDFFEPFREHYEVIFLDDFKHLLTGINTNFYGMLDQLIASKGRVFYGYVNRMRGYYVSKHKLKGWKDGTMESYYFFPDDKSNQMKTYQPVKKPIYMREFPTSWRDIDKGIDDINQ